MAKRSRQVYIDDSVWKSSRIQALSENKTISEYIGDLLLAKLKLVMPYRKVTRSKIDEPHKTS